MQVVIEKKVKGEDILKAARAQIAKAGNWHKGYMGSIGHPMCAVGALQYVLTDDPNKEDGEAQDILMKVLASCIPGLHALKGRNRIISYNDHPDTTKKDILRVFSMAIEKAKKIK